MDSENQKIIGLSKALFWDVELNSIQFKKHAPFVVERVLHFGTLEDFKLLKSFYGKPKMKKIAKNLRYMDDRVLHFCSAYFNVPLEKFQCYSNKLLNQTHWSY